MSPRSVSLGPEVLGSDLEQTARHEEHLRRRGPARACAGISYRERLFDGGEVNDRLYDVPTARTEEQE